MNDEKSWYSTIRILHLCRSVCWILCLKVLFRYHVTFHVPSLPVMLSVCSLTLKNTRISNAVMVCWFVHKNLMVRINAMTPSVLCCDTKLGFKLRYLKELKGPLRLTTFKEFIDDFQAIFRSMNSGDCISQN